MANTEDCRYIRNYVSPNFGWLMLPFGLWPSQTTSSTHSVRHPPDYDWAIDMNNRKLFDHVKYFDHLSTYKRSTVIYKFRKFVTTWLARDSVLLIGKFDKWKRSDEAKQYWRERAGATGETVDTTTTTTATVIPSTEESTVLDELAHINFTLPDNRFMVDGIDVSACFNRFQNYACQKAKNAQLSFQKNHQELLALSSVLLIKANDNSKCIKDFFGNDTLDHVKNSLHQHLQLGSNTFPLDTYGDISRILSNVVSTALDRRTARTMLSTMANQIEDGQLQRIVDCLHSMLFSFSSVEEDASDEADLCSRFILPVFQSLFNDVEGVQPLIFRLNNGDNAESKVSTFSITKKRPDGVYLLNIDGTTTTIGYLEAKPVTESRSWKKLAVDLVRLGLFAKNSIDTYNSNSVMLAQAIGADITFYLAEKKGEDVYLMLELHTITIPLTVQQMANFYNQECLNNLLDILVIFDARCKIRTPTEEYDTFHKTIRSPVIRAITGRKFN